MDVNKNSLSNDAIISLDPDDINKEEDNSRGIDNDSAVKRQKEKTNTYLTDISVNQKLETSIVEQKDLTNVEQLKQPFHESIDYGEDGEIIPNKKVVQAEKSKKADEKFSKDVQKSPNVVKETENYEQLKESYKAYKIQKESELKEKDKSIYNLNLTNQKLMSMLEDLKRDVDGQLDKVNFKQVTDKMKKGKEKENPLDIVLKVKEKELKNTANLLDIIKRDNEKLQKTVDSYTDYNKIIEVHDKLKVKEKENNDLVIEVRTLNRALEEHKRCESKRMEFEKDFKILKDDLKKAKDSLKDMQNKFKEEENKHQKTKDLLINTKREMEQLKKHKLGDLKDPKLGDKIVQNIDVNNKGKDPSNSDDINELLGNNGNSKPNEKKERIKTNLPNNNEETSQSESPYIKRLFSTDERNRLKKLLSNSDIEKIEKNFEAAERSKLSIEKRLKSDIKLLQKKVTEQEEQCEYFALQYKELEQKSKISQFQVNEYKNEQKAYQRKLNEVHIYSDKYASQLKEKEQENRILLGQLNSLRKVMKHNVVPPMDEDLQKHLEKIRNMDDSNIGTQVDINSIEMESHSKAGHDSAY